MKKTTKKTAKKYGRPTVITRWVLRDLKMAFCVDSTDKEACNLAGISEKTLYNYQKSNPDFLQQKQAWKTQIIFKARDELCKALENNPHLAFRYLERKLPKEFGCNSIRARYGFNESPDLVEAIKRVNITYQNKRADFSSTQTLS